MSCTEHPQFHRQEPSIWPVGGALSTADPPAQAQRSVVLRCDHCPLSLFFLVLGAAWVRRVGSRPEAQFCLIIHCGLQANILSCAQVCVLYTNRCQTLGCGRWTSSHGLAYIKLFEPNMSEWRFEIYFTMNLSNEHIIKPFILF